MALTAKRVVSNNVVAKRNMTQVLNVKDWRQGRRQS
jgi:hypothetical protein